MQRTVHHFSRAASAVALLAVAFGVANRAQAGDELRLGRNVLPTSESIQLVLDADKPDYTGSVRIDLDVKAETPTLRLHASEMTLTRIELEPAGGSKSKSKTKGTITLSSTAGPNGLVTLTGPAPIRAGHYVLAIDFTNDYNTNATGLYRMQTEGHGYLFTQFEADDAREAFPCFDEPGFKIPYQMTMDVPVAHLAISNTPIAKETTHDAMRTVVFKKTPPLPSYLLAIATGPLETVAIPGLGVPGRVVTVQGQLGLAQMAVEITPPLLRALEKWFGQKYPFEKLDLLAVPEYWAGAMENPGAITFSTNVLLVDSKAATVQQRRSISSITAHELAHMWFGDLVTMAWWNDLWLNESFADWMGDKITEQVFPEFRLGVTELSSVQGVMVGDSRATSEAIQRQVEPGDNMLQNVGTQYNKGKAVLAMFEQWMGPVQFQRAVRQYLKAHEWGNATADDLFAAFSKQSGMDVAGAMATFLEQPGVPLVTADVLGDGQVKLTQQRFANAGVELPPLTWKIPVSLRWSDGATTHNQVVLLSGAEQTVTLQPSGPIAWLVPNGDARGYYRWNVSADERKTLVGHLLELTPRERISFISESAALLDAGVLHGDDYLRALTALRDDTDPVVINKVADGLEKVRIAFVPDDMRDAFALYVQRTLGPALDRFGFDRKPGEDETVSFVRPSLIRWLGDRGHDTRVRAHAVEVAHQYVTDPASVDPALASVALELAAQDGDAALWDDYRTRFEGAKVPAVRSRYLGALSGFRDPALVERTLKYALEGPLRPQEILRSTGGIGETDQGRERLFRWVQDNYAAIAKRVPPEFAGFLPRFGGGGCDTQRIASLQAFFSAPEHQAPGTTTSLARTTESIQDCANLREREGPAVAAYLSELASRR